jgi:hypothetical protein
VIKERHTSRDGFISFYSNNFDDWVKPLSKYDHNELGTLLTAYAESSAIEIKEIDFRFIERILVDELVHSAINWNEFEEKRKNARMEE